MQVTVMDTMTTQKPRILFVDDEVAILNALKRFVRRFNWHCEFTDSPLDAVNRIKSEHFDVVVSDMKMPQMNGAKLLTHCAEESPDTVRILLTGFSDLDTLVDAVNIARVYNYVAKPWDDHLLGELLDGAVRYSDTLRENRRLHLLTRKHNQLLQNMNRSLEQKVDARTTELQMALQELHEHNRSLSDQFQQMVSALVGLIDHKDVNRSNHSKSVADLCAAVADKLRLSPGDKEDLFTAAILHDIGLLGLNSGIIKQSLSQLNERELAEYRSHCILGEAAVAGIGANEAVCAIVRMHHEKIDGSGYPDRLTGKQIPVGAKILSVVSDYHDLLHGFMVDNVHGTRGALNYLRGSGKHQYDQTIVQALGDVLKRKTACSVGSIPVRSEELVEGMRLAEDVISESGLLLLTAGQELSFRTINRLIRYEREMNTVLSIIIEVSHQIILDELPLESERMIA